MKQKKAWSKPELTEYGKIEDVTRDIKSKTFGGGDDVLVNQDPILSDIS